MNKDTAKKIANEIFKEAIYYYRSPSIFRPNFNELTVKEFTCPKCKAILHMPRNRIIKKVYVCTNCNYEIPQDNVLYDKKILEEFQQNNK